MQDSRRIGAKHVPGVDHDDAKTRARIPRLTGGPRRSCLAVLAPGAVPTTTVRGFGAEATVPTRAAEATRTTDSPRSTR